MNSHVELRYTLGKAFLVQAALISIVAVLGVYAARFVLEEVLIKQALRDEANHYWALRAGDPTVPPPDTRNLTGYIYDTHSRERVPEALSKLDLGFHGVASQADYTVAYITQRDDQRLLLVFDGENVGDLAVYFGLVPLAGVLVVLYLGAWLAYRQSRRAVSPIIALAREVHELDPEHPDLSKFRAEGFAHTRSHEVSVLAEALSRLASRINDFVDRERAFTRDASHELRSPLTVIKLAADMLLSEQELTRPARNSVLRIQRATKDMEELVEAFLILARESDQGFSEDPVCVNDLVAEEIRRASVLLENKPVEVKSSADCRLVALASEKVLSVLIGNLIRNAFSYTDEGRVCVHVGDGYISIEDSGVGIPEQDVEQVFKPFYRGHSRRRGGYGVGLTIVRRVSDRFNWPVHIESEPDVGTKVTVELPGAKAEPVHAV